jgi:hypothetical protein
MAAAGTGDGGTAVTAAAVAPPRRLGVLAAGLLAIVVWQGVLFRFPNQPVYPLDASGGVLVFQPEFVYFLYYLNLFPLATEAPVPRAFSVRGAQQVIAEHGRALVMDRFWTVRYGELLKTYLYLPHSYLKGKPGYKMKYANGPAFTLALLLLFSALWWVGETRLGLILVLLMGSNPFQVFEVYAHSNIFGWAITTTLLVLALHVPLLSGRPTSPLYCWALPIVTGLLLASIRQIRTEPVLVIGAAGLAYLFASSLRWRARLALTFLLGLSFLWGSQEWIRYFDAKFAQVRHLVELAGGHPYDGPRQSHHFFWHAIWCGLGDFDRRYGYAWDDLAAAAYALPIMKERYGFVPQGYTAEPDDPRVKPLTLGVSWDPDGKYPRTPFEVPEYVDVVRDKVLHDIVHDPAWYLTILAKRLFRILATTTAPSLTFGDGWLLRLPDSALYGVGALLVTGLLAWARKWMRLRMIAFTLPLAAPALLVYSGLGVAYYNVYHLVAFGIGVDWALANWRYGRKRSPAAMTAGTDRAESR